MENRELFFTDPVELNIPNDGVTTVYTPQTDSDWEVVNYELKSFVCEGEYYRGLERILSTFLGHLDNPKQPAVWVSGFYGSGKSHLVRVLQYLWSDVELPDGARARSLVNLPQDIQDYLRELTTRGKQAGGLWSAAGKLTSSQTESVRLGLLGILCQCAGLPEKYHLAKFVIWLKQKGFYEAVCSYVESQGDSFADELLNLYVSMSITDGLLQVYPTFANTPADARKHLIAQFPEKEDISDDEFLNTVEYILELEQQIPGKLPLTVIVFDELQQFLGDDSDRLIQLQNVVEACSARMGSKLLFIGTGQASLDATPQLSKLKDRFTVNVMLEDSDVETVVRQVILRKAADKVSTLENVLDVYRAEIDRQLVGTQIAPTASDNAILVADYPLLPTRRRFWERVLRAIDTAGTAAQLRTQLRIVHEANKIVALRPVGTVVPADVVYQQQESSMLQGGILLREVATLIKSQNDGTPEGNLKERLCSLIFLIGKLPSEGAALTGIKANADTLADLLVEDLTQGSVGLRQQIPVLLEELATKGLLMKVDDEYRLQTAEGSRWEEDYRKRFNSIRASDDRIASDRSTELRKFVTNTFKRITLVQGESKTPRKSFAHFSSDTPKFDNGQIPVWIQDEWSATEKTVRDAAQSSGIENPIVFVFLPKRDSDAIRDALATYGAAKETLDTRPNPTTPEGFEARRSMETRKVVEEKRLEGLIKAVVEKGRVFQGGGNELVEDTFLSAVTKALQASLIRMFGKFNYADHAKWGEVVKKAQEGSQDALKLVGFTDNANQHPVCQEILKYIGTGKKGADIRKSFTGVGYGWPQDAIDGALLVLFANDQVIAIQNGQPVKSINQAQISITEFRQQDAPITTAERIALRSLFNELGVNYKANQEGESVPAALQVLSNALQEAGGPPPLPEKPSLKRLEEIIALSGNKQMKEMAAAKQELVDAFKFWIALKEKRLQRLPRWESLQVLKKHAKDLPIAGTVEPQIQAILSGRTLLTDPDPVVPLLNQLADALRTALQEAYNRYTTEYQNGMAQLSVVEAWQKIDASQRQMILLQCKLLESPKLSLGTEQELISTLETQSLAGWENQIKALPARFSEATLQATKLLEPEVINLKPQSGMFRSMDEADAYLSSLREEIKKYIDNGNPVVI